MCTGWSCRGHSMCRETYGFHWLQDLPTSVSSLKTWIQVGYTYIQLNHRPGDLSCLICTSTLPSVMGMSPLPQVCRALELQGSYPLFFASAWWFSLCVWLLSLADWMFRPCHYFYTLEILCPKMLITNMYQWLHCCLQLTYELFFLMFMVSVLL